MYKAKDQNVGGKKMPKNQLRERAKRPIKKWDQDIIIHRRENTRAKDLEMMLNLVSSNQKNAS